MRVSVQVSILGEVFFLILFYHFIFMGEAYNHKLNLVGALKLNTGVHKTDVILLGYFIAPLANKRIF